MASGLSGWRDIPFTCLISDGCAYCGPMTFSLPSITRDWRQLSFFGIASLSPALLAVLLTLLAPAESVGRVSSLMHPVAPESAQWLDAAFARIDYSWPPKRQVPALAITHLPRDMATLEIGKRKELFLRMLLPLVLAENWRLRQERRWVEGVMANRGQRSRLVHERLHRLAEEYGLGMGPEKTEEVIAQLYERIDELPPALVLAQAANESGWGTSRFSREANNLFGEWTYNAAEGILPLRRLPGARHYVRRFAQPYDSVRSYMKTINRGRAYASLRKLRAGMRREGRDLDPVLLANGLVRYSEMGMAYVAAIQALIRGNRLDTLESVLLTPRSSMVVALRSLK